MKIAIVSPMILPVSKFRGGAVEQLILNIVEENENVDNNIYIDIYTVGSLNINYMYKKCKINIINNPNKYSIIFQKINNLKNKLLNNKKRYVSINIKTIKELKKNVYDKVIVENGMILYRDIYNKCDFKDCLYYHMHNNLGDIDKTKENYIFIENTAQKIFVVSNYIKEELFKIKESKKIEVLYNAIDKEKFIRNNIKKEEIINLKKEFNLNKSDFVIGYCGRITEEKGILELILAFKKLSKKIKNIKLLIIGSSWFNLNKEDKFLEKLKQETEDIESKIVFTGYINYNKIPIYYQLMNLIVIPSKCNEAFGLVGLEALYANIPIISSNDGGLLEILKDKAIIVDKKNLELKIFENLKKVIENKKTYDKLLQIEKNFIEKNNDFIKEEYYKKFIKLLGE